MNRFLNRYFGMFRDGDRWRAFLHNPLWLALPLVGALAFGAIFLLLKGDPATGTEQARQLGWLSAGLVAFGWILGLWAAAGPDPEPEAGNRENAPETGGRRVLNLLGVAGGVLLMLAAIAWPDIRDIVSGEASPARGIAGVLTKFLVVAAVFVPVWIDIRKKG